MAVVRNNFIFIHEPFDLIPPDEKFNLFSLVTFRKQIREPVIIGANRFVQPIHSLRFGWIEMMNETRSERRGTSQSEEQEVAIDGPAVVRAQIGRRFRVMRIVKNVFQVVAEKEWHRVHTDLKQHGASQECRGAGDKKRSYRLVRQTD